MNRFQKVGIEEENSFFHVRQLIGGKHMNDFRHIFNKSLGPNGEDGYYCLKCFRDTHGSYTEWVNMDCSISDDVYEKNKVRSNRKSHVPVKIRKIFVKT